MEKIKAGYRREMNHNYMIIEAFSDDTECYEAECFPVIQSKDY